MSNETTVIATSQDIPEFPVLIFDTTGPMGGDAGHGGNAYIGLVAGTTGAGLLVVDREGNDLLDYEMGDEVRVFLSVCGDWETGALEDAICELADEIRARAGGDQ